MVQRVNNYMSGVMLEIYNALLYISLSRQMRCSGLVELPRFHPPFAANLVVQGRGRRQ